MHAFMHYACGGVKFFLWKIHKNYYRHFETFFKTNGAWGQELWTIAISFGEGFDAVLDICYIVRHQYCFL